jgi:hypothetical protein
LTLRKRKGRRTLCSWETTCSCCSSESPLPLNQASKSSLEEKTSAPHQDYQLRQSLCPTENKLPGKIKFRSAHNSCKLFCKGVPVMSSLPRLVKLLTIWLSKESTFLILCASSMMIYSQANFCRTDFSLKQTSYEVMRTSKSETIIRFLIISARTRETMKHVPDETVHSKTTHSFLLGSL